MEAGVASEGTLVVVDAHFDNDRLGGILQNRKG